MYSKEFLNFIVGQIIPDPLKRMGASEALSQKWIECVDPDTSPSLDKPINVTSYVSPRRCDLFENKNAVVLNVFKTER
jgi:hypothetical protein